MLPVYVILNTRDLVVEFLKSSVRLGLTFFSLRHSGSEVFAALYNRDPSYRHYNRCMFYYDNLSSLLDENPDKVSEAMMEEIEILFLGLEDEMARFGMFDASGFSQYVFHSWTPDHCAVMMEVRAADEHAKSGDTRFKYDSEEVLHQCI